MAPRGRTFRPLDAIRCRKYCPRSRVHAEGPSPRADSLARTFTRKITFAIRAAHIGPEPSHRGPLIQQRASAYGPIDGCPQLVEKMGSAPLMEEFRHANQLQRGKTVLGGWSRSGSAKPFDAFIEERIFKPLGCRTPALVRPAGAKRARTRGR